MDINLPDMLGIEASRMMREKEADFNNVHTNIIAVTMEGLSGKFISLIFRNGHADIRWVF